MLKYVNFNNEGLMIFKVETQSGVTRVGRMLLKLLIISWTCSSIFREVHKVFLSINLQSTNL